MRIIFSGDPFQPKQPEEAYAREAAACDALGILWSPLNFEAIVYENDWEQAVRRVLPVVGKEAAVYRGWMLTPTQYGGLFGALAARGLRLINSPAEYEHCHYLPRWYESLKDDTPRSIWTEAGEDLFSEDLSPAHLTDRLRVFGPAPLIVKDWVKSRKHEWHEACFIPSAADAEAAGRVTRRFLELQGDDLNVGLVFREFAALEPLATHSRSGMPLTREHRLFFLDGDLLLSSRCWDEGDYPEEAPPLDHFQTLARKIGSRFFTMDVAKKMDGGWLVVELGDAQVAELSVSADPEAFYAGLSKHSPERTGLGEGVAGLTGSLLKV